MLNCLYTYLGGGELFLNSLLNLFFFHILFLLFFAFLTRFTMMTTPDCFYFCVLVYGTLIGITVIGAMVWKIHRKIYSIS